MSQLSTGLSDCERPTLRANNSAQGPPSGGSMNIETFCQRNAISRSLFYTMVKKGIAPALMRLGGVVRISTAAEAAWQRAQEKRSKGLPMRHDVPARSPGRPKKRTAA